MDIHKPKPWHGLREFFKEYLIIVVGVLTALAAEAVVQNLHDRRLSSEADAAVRGEIALNLTNIGHRTEMQSCINARLKEISDLLDKAERGDAFAPARFIVPVSTRVAYTQRWQASTAGGRTSLLSADEQQQLARVYQQFAAINERKALEEQAWMRLGALRDRDRLSAEEIARAREALSEARGQSYWIRVNIFNANTWARTLGIEPKGDPPERALVTRVSVLPFCLPITTSREEAQRIVQDKLGADY